MIYFIEATGANLVKIGFTERDVEQRMKELQTGCPHKLRVVATMDGEASDEAELHGTFNHLRANGEWFRFEGELRLLLWLVPRVFGVQQAISQRLNSTRGQLHEWMKDAVEQLAILGGHLFPADGERNADGVIKCSLDTIREEVAALDDRFNYLNDQAYRLWQAIETLQDSRQPVMSHSESARSVVADCRE